MEAEYYSNGGFDFTSVFAVFIAVIAIYMLFVLGSAIHEYATGRTREFPLAFLIVRIIVVLGIAQIVGTWFR